MATKAEQRVIHEARLVHLAWLGAGVDGGKALREALQSLHQAFEKLDGPSQDKKAE